MQDIKEPMSEWPKPKDESFVITEEEPKKPREVGSDWGIFIIVLVVLILSIAIWFFVWRGSFKTFSFSVQKPAGENSNGATGESQGFTEKVSSSTDTSDWNLYTLAKADGDFSFKIPKDWQTLMDKKELSDPLFEALLDPNYFVSTENAAATANQNLNGNLITATQKPITAFDLYTLAKTYENTLVDYLNAKNNRAPGTKWLEATTTLSNKTGMKYNYTSADGTYDIIDIVIPLNKDKAKTLVIRLNNAKQKAVFDAFLTTFVFR